MIFIKKLNVVIILLFSSTLLISCNGKLPGADARKFPADPKKELNKTFQKEEVLDFQTLINLEVEFLSLRALMSYGEHL
jgi:hypothetical protein